MKRFYLVKDLSTNCLVPSNWVGIDASSTDYIPKGACYKIQVCDKWIFFDKYKNVLVCDAEKDGDNVDYNCLLFFDSHSSENSLLYYDKEKYEFIEINSDEIELRGIGGQNDR